MKIGLDLDGTIYAHQAFFEAMVVAMQGTHQFFCISSHSRDQWREKDSPLLLSRGYPALASIDPSLMHDTQHGSLSIKGRAADQCDIVFDDDTRLANFTKTPVFSPVAPGSNVSNAWGFSVYELPRL